MKTRSRIVALCLLLLMLAAAGCASAKTGVQTEFDIRADNEYMQVAIDEALDGISRQHGGPFGCVIVKDGRIVGHVEADMIIFGKTEKLPAERGPESIINVDGKEMIVVKWAGSMGLTEIALRQNVTM